MGTTQPIRNQQELENFKAFYLQQKPSRRNYLLIMMGLNTALRISDLLKLQFQDIYDFEKRKIKEHLTVTEKKTKKENIVYLNHELRRAISDCLDFQTASGSDWIFQSQIQKENSLSRQQAFRIVKKAAEYAGISGNISCHSLRKTFGYFAWKQGVLPTMLMEIYNHSSYKITKRYLGIEQDDKDEIYKKICI